MNHEDPDKHRPTWQLRLDAIHLHQQYGMTVGDIARVLSCDQRQIKYWLGNYPSQIRQGDVY